MAEINTPEDYYSNLSSNHDGSNDDFYKIAYDQATTNRNFEIELYWKRAIYFWTFLGLAFGGFFLIEESKYFDYLQLRVIISVIGLVLSTAWYFVNKGSKYWQENWETHVSLLERKITGPLYMTILEKEKQKKYKTYTAFPFSVSKINLVLSRFTIFVWLMLSVYCCNDFIEKNGFKGNYLIILFFILIAILYIFKLSKSESDINEPSKRFLMDYNIVFKFNRDDKSSSD